jgi:phosphate/sulfate permease
MKGLIIAWLVTLAAAALLGAAGAFAYMHHDLMQMVRP